MPRSRPYKRREPVPTLFKGAWTRRQGATAGALDKRISTRSPISVSMAGQVMMRAWRPVGTHWSPHADRLMAA
jgi:hypothetical protein